MQEITNVVDVATYISVEDKVETSEDLSDEGLVDLTNNIEPDLIEEDNSSASEDHELSGFNKCSTLADITRTFDFIKSMGKIVKES